MSRRTFAGAAAALTAMSFAGLPTMANAEVIGGSATPVIVGNTLTVTVSDVQSNVEPAPPTSCHAWFFTRVTGPQGGGYIDNFTFNPADGPAVFDLTEIGFFEGESEFKVEVFCRDSAFGGYQMFPATCGNRWFHFTYPRAEDEVTTCPQSSPTITAFSATPKVRTTRRGSTVKVAVKARSASGPLTCSVLLATSAGGGEQVEGTIRHEYTGKRRVSKTATYKNVPAGQWHVFAECLDKAGPATSHTSTVTVP